MNARHMMTVMCLTAAAAAFGETKATGGNGSFLVQQAVAEMQRVSGQVDVLQTNLSDLQRRIGSLEGGGEAKGIRQEVESLKASIADLRAEMRNMRGEIVKELSAKIVQISKTAAPAAPTVTKTILPAGTFQVYEVAKGDTLSIIAQAFNTSVAKIKEMNGLKSDVLRVGQKLNVPK